MTDEYKTIASPASGMYREKGSRFLAFAFPVSDETEVKEHIRNIRKEHHQCNHHCYAYCIHPGNQQCRASDDREPAGTAGKPIQNRILSAGLQNILIIVARYFGGTLLGKAGLINAYGAAAADAIAHAEVITCTIDSELSFDFSYEHFNTVMRILKSEPVKIIRQQAGERTSISLMIRRSRHDALQERLKTTLPVNIHH